MTKFKLPRRFHIVDTITVDDPLEIFDKWTLRYFGNPDHLKYQQEHGSEEALDPIIREQQKYQTLAAMEAAEKKLRGKVLGDYIQRRSIELFRENLNDMDMARIDAQTSDPEGLARFVVENVTGMVEESNDGKERPVDYRPELGVEFLASTQPIPFAVSVVVGEGDDAETLDAEAGTHVGPFYCRWIRAVSTRVDAFRQTELELAGKGLPATSVGSSG